MLFAIQDAVHRNQNKPNATDPVLDVARLKHIVSQILQMQLYMTCIGQLLCRGSDRIRGPECLLSEALPIQFLERLVYLVGLVEHVCLHGALTRVSRSVLVRS